MAAPVLNLIAGAWVAEVPVEDQPPLVPAPVEFRLGLRKYTAPGSAQLDRVREQAVHQVADQIALMKESSIVRLLPARLDLLGWGCGPLHPNHPTARCTAWQGERS